MAVELAEAYISLVPSFQGIEGKIEKGMAGPADKAGKSVGKRFGVGMSGAIGAAVAGLGVLDFLKDANAEAREAEKVGKTTAAVIKATGGAAKVSADQVGDLAGALSAKAGVDDEVIQQGANLLLTFKNVRNEAGKGAQIFDRATAAAVDLSAAGFGSVDGAAKMLGKALNDPVRGITALNRAGVTFTDSQKEQIKTLVESGNTLAAQKLIMQEVESQVGGVAAANATASEKMQVAWGNFKEGVGTALLPVMDAVANVVVEKVLPAATNLVDLLSSKAGPAFAGVAEAARPILEQVGPLISGIVSNWIGLFKQLAPAVGPFLTTLFGVAQQLFPVFQQLQRTVFAAIATVVSQLLPAVGGLLTAILPALGQIGQAVGTVLAAVIPVVSEIIGTLVGALSENMPTIQEAFRNVGEIISGVANLIMTVWGAVGPVLLPLIKTVFGTVVKIIGGAFDIIGGLVKVITGLITGDWKKAGEGLKQIIGGAWKIIRSIFEGALNAIKIVFGAVIGWVLDRTKGFRETIVSIFTTVINFVKGGFARGVEFIRTIFNNVLTAGKNIVRGHIDTVRGIFRAVTDWLRNTFSPAFAKVKGWITAPIEAAKKVVGDILDKTKTIFSKAVEGIGKAWDGLKEAAKKPVKFVIETVVNGLIGKFNDISKVFNGPHIEPLSLPPGFHGGGWTGPGAKYTPAGVVHADEFVINKAARGMFEKKFPGYLSYINEHGDMPGYADGGLVSWKGKTFSSLFARNLQLAEQMSGTSFSIFQGGYRPTTSYSGTSHAKDAIDLAPITNAVIVALRRVGIAAWDRTGKGNWAPHIHAVPTPGAGFAGGSAVWQAQDYLRGGDGLGGRDNGPRVNAGSGVSLPGGFDLGFFTNPLQSFKDAVGGTLDKLGEIANSPFGKFAAGIPGKLVDLAAEKIADLVNPFGYANGTVGARGGLNLVGERSAELVLGRSVRNFQGGERVIPLGAGGLGERIEFKDCKFGADEDVVVRSIDKRKRRSALRAGLRV